MSDEIKNKIWNQELLVNEIRDVPQTYNTILRELYKDGTCQTLLRRKISSLCKYGDICKINIPGTRRGKAILYCVPKKYFILVEANRAGESNTYYFFNYKKESNFYLTVNEYWELENNNWKKHNKKKKFFHGNVLKWI